MKPVIGLIPLVDDERQSLWMLPGYMDGLTAAGALPIMLPLTDDLSTIMQFAKICDGFLLTGGHDVSPQLYGEDPLPFCGPRCLDRDLMEGIVLKYAIENDVPVLGICRGHQFINAAMRGPLYQDLPTQHPSPVNHHQNPPYDVPVHDVHVLPNTPLHDLLGKDVLHVNSYHHQAVREIASCLSPMALSPDGLVEALWMPDKRFIWGVQWHPEFAYQTDPDCLAIFSKFVSACHEE